MISPLGIEFGVSCIIQALVDIPNPMFVCRSTEEAEEWIVKNRGGVPMPAPEE